MSRLVGLFCSYRSFFFLLPFFTFCTTVTSEEISGKLSGRTYQNEGFNSFNQNVTTPPIPDSTNFAGEEVPLQNFDVRESLIRELTSLSYFHGTMLYIMQLDNRYGSEIKEILQAEGVPEDLYYICIAESGLQPVISPAGAAGYWQFLTGTAKEYGLVVDNEVDERYNIQKSTKAAAAYFKKAYEEFGSWAMAAASYNTGFKNLRYRMDIQSQTNYFDTQFVEETARYLFRALAFKIILNNRELYGFNIPQEHLYKKLEYYEVTVDGSIDNWSDFAREHNTNFKMIKIFNQWIRANYLHNRSRRTYVVRVPKSGFRES
jgi:hypothetical protein